MNYAIILAAGKGTRMKTKLPKCAFPLLKKPMVEYIVDSLEKTSIDSIICVVGHKKEVIQEILGKRVKYAIQKEQLGTGHAVKCAKDFIEEDGYTIIMPGDTPLIDKEIIEQMINTHLSENNDFTIGTIVLDNPFGFGRIIRNSEGLISGIIEEKDASEDVRKIKEINTGLFCINNKLLFEAVEKIKNKNVKGEYYLTDIVSILADKAKISSFTIKDTYKLQGINDLYALSQVEKKLIEAVNKKHMLNGVSIVNPETTTISPDVIIEEGTIIYPGCMLMGKTKIGKDCIIGPDTETFNAIIEDNVTCKQSVVYDSKIKAEATVGPFAHLRMYTVVGKRDRIGNFVEIKNSELGEDTKVSHLTYIGDTTCGSHVNWGCGSVTVNYDGKTKYRTTIGDNVFIGCNSNLIAPITIGNSSFIAAGSTITDSLENDDFSIARAKQVTKKKYAKKYKN